jgi:hypothetical protein
MKILHVRMRCYGEFKEEHYKNKHTYAKLLLNPQTQTSYQNPYSNPLLKPPTQTPYSNSLPKTPTQNPYPKPLPKPLSQIIYMPNIQSNFILPSSPIYPASLNVYTLELWHTYITKEHLGAVSLQLNYGNSTVYCLRGVKLRLRVDSRP